MFLATIPAVLFVDNFGRKVILIVGGIGMATSHFIVAGITGAFAGNWENNRGAGWAAVVFVWIYSICFGFSWGPVSWIVVSEVFPLGLRAKGVSLGVQSNWMNNVSLDQVSGQLPSCAVLILVSLLWLWQPRLLSQLANLAPL